MGIYVELFKSDTTKSGVVRYRYEFSRATESYKNSAGKVRCKLGLFSGDLEINKKTGEVRVVKLAEKDEGIFVQRAILVLIKHWKKGEYPDKTCWAS